MISKIKTKKYLLAILFGVLLLTSLYQTSQAALVTSGLIVNLDASNPASWDGTVWSDSSGNVDTATAINSPTYSASEGSFTFNGTNQYFNVGNPANLNFYNNAAFTIEVVFKPNSLSGYQRLISRFNGGSVGNYMLSLSDSRTAYSVSYTHLRAHET